MGTGNETKAVTAVVVTVFFTGFMGLRCVTLFFSGVTYGLLDAMSPVSGSEVLEKGPTSLTELHN